MMQWKTLPMWDRLPLHMAVEARGTEDVERLLAGVEVSASHAAPAMGLLVAGDSSGNIHVIHPLPLVLERTLSATHIGTGNSNNNMHIESFPAFDASPVLCVRVVVADASLTLSSRLRNVVPSLVDQTAALASDIHHAVVIFAAGQDRDGLSVIRVISYTPSVRSTASLSVSAATTVLAPPFTIFRNIKPTPIAQSPVRRRSIGSTSASSNAMTANSTADGHRSDAISTFSVYEPSLTHIVIGYTSGAVISLKGDILRDRASKQKVIVPPMVSGGATFQAEQVTGLFFREINKDPLSLYIVTAQSTKHASLSGNRDTLVTLADLGANRDCSVMSDESGDLFVCAGDAVYQLSPEGRGPCFVLPGVKIKAMFIASQLFLLTYDALLSRHTLTAYSLRHRYIAYIGHFSDIVKLTEQYSVINTSTMAASNKGLLIFAGQEGKGYLLEERDAYDKLDIAIKKELFQLALAIANEEYKCGHIDNDVVVGVITKYGDYLYNKSDFDGAMEQYIMTIGHLEPSHIIRKFLDAQRVRNLVKYLEVLHAMALGNADHTTLLLNCYTKGKDMTKLDKFLKNDDNLTFDVDTAIRVCRQAGYFTHALALARKFEQHDMYFRVQVEDVHDYAQALQYMTEVLMPNLILVHEYFDRYGASLIAHIPKQATAMIISLLENSSEQDRPRAQVVDAERYIHLFPVSQTTWLCEFLEFMIRKFPDTCSPVIWNTLIEVYLALSTNTTTTLSGSEDENKTSTQLTARSRSESPTHRERSALSIMNLLRNPQDVKAQYDNNHALNLCQHHHYVPGLLYLFEKMQLYHDILDIYEHMNDYDMILAVCQQHGALDPDLWRQGLIFLADHQADPSCAPVFDAFLSAIQQNALISPLQVMQTLAKYPHLTLGHIRGYISSHLRAERDKIDEDEATAASYRQDTATMRQEVEELTNKPTLFQVNQCSACGGILEIPAAHFLCKHSFHLSCLNETEQECPKCAPQQRTLLQIRKSLNESAAQSDQFYEQLQDAEDGYDVIAEWFSKKAILEDLDR